MRKHINNYQTRLLAAIAALGFSATLACAQTPVACGQTITNNISAPSETDQYTYTGTMGETVALAFWGPNNCWGGDAKVLDFRNPTGQIIASLHGCGPVSSNITLAASGTYTILVHDDNYTETGDYAFSLQSFTGGGCNTAAIGCGQTTSGTITYQAEVDAFGLSASAGMTLTLSFSGFGGATFDLYDPTGNPVFSCVPGTATNITLAASGGYTLLVHDDNFQEGGDYAFSLQSFTSGGCNSTQVTCGETVTNSISQSSECDAYQYVGTMGETLALAFWGPNNCWGGDAKVLDFYNPTGQLIASLHGCGVVSSNITLAASGTYTILVHDDNYTETGDYAFSLQSFTSGGCNSTQVTCGETVANSISQSSECDAYQYVGIMGETLALAFWGPNNCWGGDAKVLDFYNPTGQLIASLHGCGVVSSNITLAASGTYTILVHDDNYQEGGDYAISLQSFTSGGCNSTQVTCGETVTNSISQSSECDAYQYVGTMGETLALAFWGPNNCWGGDAKVLDFYNPTGQLIASLHGCGVVSSNITLAASGTYTILVHDDNYTETGDYAFSFQSFTSGGCQSTAIGCGQTMSGGIGGQAEVDAFGFGVCSGMTVIFSFSGFGGATFDLYDPTGNPVFSCVPGTATNITLAATGAYTLLVHDDNYTETGDYSFTTTCIGGSAYSINPTSVSVGAGATTNTVIVTAAAGCNWTATSNDSWLTIISGATGSGNGTVAYVVAANTGPEREGTLTIAGLMFQVHQEGCSYVINPTEVSVGPGATSGIVSVTTDSACSWTATTNASWLRITSGASGSGNGTVSYSVDANTSTNSRHGTMTIAGKPFSVDQGGIAGWVGNDVGDVNPPGGFTVSGDVFTIWGDGEDIEGNADAFYFVHRSLSGDSQIVARLLSLQGGDSGAEAGLMMRENLTSDSRHVFLAAGTDKEVLLRRRLAPHANSVQNAHPGTNYAWLRLMRMGNTFVGHCSTNGTNWEYMWFTTIDMPSQLEVGLAVTAHNKGLLSTGIVDSVTVGNVTPLSGAWPEAQPRIWLGGEPSAYPPLAWLGGLKFLVGGTVGDRFNIKYSANVEASLATWQSLGTVTNTYGVVPFTDSQALTNPRRFYRAQSIGP